MRRANIVLAVSLLLLVPDFARAQQRSSARFAQLRALIDADEEASMEVVRVTPGAEVRDLRRSLSRGRERPNLRLRPMQRCRQVDRGGWRGAEVIAAFEGARRACALVPPRRRANGLHWFRLRWGTDDDDFKAEAVGFVVFDSRHGRAWVVEYHWSWFDR